MWARPLLKVLGGLLFATSLSIPTFADFDRNIDPCEYRKKDSNDSLSHRDYTQLWMKSRINWPPAVFSMKEILADMPSFKAKRHRCYWSGT